MKLLPPPGYASWLDYAVDCMDTRSLELESMFEDNYEKSHWPKGTTREQMNQAVREELAELRLLVEGQYSNSNQRGNAHAGSDFADYLREEGLLEEVDATAIKKMLGFPVRINGGLESRECPPTLFHSQ